MGKILRQMRSWKGSIHSQNQKHPLWRSDLRSPGKKGIKKKQKLESSQGMKNIMKKENTDPNPWPDLISRRWLKEQGY